LLSTSFISVAGVKMMRLPFPAFLFLECTRNIFCVHSKKFFSALP